MKNVSDYNRGVLKIERILSEDRKVNGLRLLAVLVMLTPIGFWASVRFAGAGEILYESDFIRIRAVPAQSTNSRPVVLNPLFSPPLHLLQMAWQLMRAAIYSWRILSTTQSIKSRPAGLKSVFATGLNVPVGLAINASGDLFKADNGSSTI